MAVFARGDIVVLPFPLSSVTSTKRRPALVLASWPFGRGEDYLVCMITTQRTTDPRSIEIDPKDVIGGKLMRTSYIRPTYVFTADDAAIVGQVGRLVPSKVSQSLAALEAVLK